MRKHICRKILTLSILPFLLGCCGTPAPEEQPNHELTTASQLETSLGKEIRFVGVAENLKMGACLQGNGCFVFVRNQRSWNTSTLGQVTSLSGVVSRYPPPKSSQDPRYSGPQMDGEGYIYYIESPNSSRP